MNSAFTLAKKDIKLLLRDKSAMFWVLVFPLLIAILFGSIFGGSGDSNAIKVAVIDQDGSKESKGFVDRLRSSTAVSIKDPAGKDPVDEVRRGNLSAYILIPKGYGEAARSMQYAKGPAIQVGIDPSKKAESGMLQGVVSESAYKGMSEMFSQPVEMRESVQEGLKSLQEKGKPEDASTVRYLGELDRYLASGGMAGTGGNGFSFEGPKIEQIKVQAEGTQPASAFDLTFPQAILWGLLGVITTFAISMVKERQQGTLIRLRVSPMSFAQILGGKGLACFMACVGVIIALLVVGMVIFHVRLQSPGLLALAIVSSAFCLVGVMMLLSVLGRTEQAVSGSAWGVLIIMAMFGGGMIPVFMMPPWMQAAGSFSPLKWTVISLEGALWRGFALRDMLTPCLLLVAIGVVCFGIGVQVLRKTATASS